VIVVDSNVIAYCWISGERTVVAQRVRLRDPDWHAPILWRSEIRNVLAGYARQGALQPHLAAEIMDLAESALGGREHVVASALVLELARASGLSAYDCEFVALAESLAVPLVTEDREILKAFPGRAVSMEGFLASSEKEPPRAHMPAAGYRAHRRAGRTTPASAPARARRA
jgi:predicted nucleic acid-binding protein